MSSSTAIVYCALNILNNKEYIGATEKTMAERRSRHHWRATNEPAGKFHRALIKYGFDNFVWFVIAECPDFFSALDVERIAIAERKPAYNITTGGGGVKGLRHTAEAKEKMRTAKVGKPSAWTKTRMPQSVRDRLAECRRAERGRETTASQRAAYVENAKKANEGRRKVIIELSSGKVYKSVTEAALAYNLTTGAISYLCKEGKSRRGLSFRQGDGNGQ